MLTLPETARPRHRLHLADFAVETFTPLDDLVTPSMWEAPGSSSPEAAGCPCQPGTGQSNKANCKTCNAHCDSGGNCSNPVDPDGE